MTTDPKSRPRLPLGSVRSMVELLRHPVLRMGSERPWTRGPRPRGQCLATRNMRRRNDMGSGEARCFVGIDVAKQTHVVCALEAPSGAIRLKPSQIEASAEGYARLHRVAAELGRARGNADWDGGDRHVVGATLRHTDAGRLPSAAPQSAADRLLGRQPGLAGQDGWHRRPHARAWPAGWSCPTQHPALRDHPGLARTHPRPA